MTTKIVIVDYGMGNLLDYAEDKPRLAGLTTRSRASWPATARQR